MVSSALAGIVALACLAGCAAHPGPDADADSLTSRESRALLSESAGAQSKGDELPAFLLEGSQSLEGVVAESSRRLAKSDGVTYWLAENEASEACLILLLPGSDQYASMTCQPTQAVWKTGLVLEAQSDAHSVRSIFVPAGYPTVLSGYRSAGPQLLVGSASVEADAVTLHPEPGAASRIKSHGADHLEIPAFSALPEPASNG
jgi:hypothetical protein